MAKLNQICINGDCSETPSAFAKVNVDGTVLSADSNDDTLNVEAGTNITLTPNIASDTVEISAPNVYNKTEVDDLISGIGGLKWVKDVDGSGQTSLQGVVENDVANNVVTGMYSHAEGEGTTASGLKSHAEGEDTVASGDMSHAEGRNSVASGYNAHAEGSLTQASGGASHAEGYFAKATGQASHAEGYNTKATASNAHAEGILSQATAEEAHAEGEETLASGESSHAEGSNTEASGSTSHAEGMRTKASSRNQHVQGRYNVEDANDVYAHIVGNGTSNANRSNAYALKWTGASTQKAAVEIQDMYIPQTTPAPANGYYGVHNDVAYRIVDSSGNTVGYLTDFFTDSRGRGVQLSVERTVAGEVLNNDLTLGIDDNGDATVEVTDGDAWTGAIGAVKKTGDTMTGRLSVEAPAKFVSNATDITSGGTLSSLVFGNELLSTDSNGSLFFRATSWQAANGNLTAALSVRNKATPTGPQYSYNELQMTQALDGTNSVRVSAPAAWRSAIGVDTLSSTSFTSNGGTVYLRKATNGLVTIDGSMDTIASAQTTSSSAIPSGYRPARVLYLVGLDSGNNMRRLRINTTGTITAYSGTTTGIWFCATYSTI